VPPEAKGQPVAGPTVAEALRHPVLARAELVGGRQGLSRRIAWVHVSELLDVARFLQGNELLLTTGMALAHASPGAREAYLSSLAERGIAALGIELVQWMRSLPGDFSAWADAAGIPLLVFREEVRFEAISQAICTLVLSRRTALLEALEEATRALLEGFAEGGLPGFAAALERLLPGQRVAVRPGPGPEEPGLWIPLTAGEEVLGVLGLVPGEGLDEVGRLVAERAAHLLAAHLAMARAQEEARRREALERLNALLLPDLFPGPPPYHPAWMGLALGEGVGEEALWPLLGEGVEAWGWRVGGARLFLLGGRRPALERVARALEGRDGVGVGPVVDGGCGARHTLREALWRLRYGQDALGLAPLLVPDPELHLAYARARLAPLLGLPPGRRRALGETLRVLLEEGNRTRAADRLGIRRQSLYRRLALLESLLGPLTPGRPDLLLALRILTEAGEL